MIILQGQQLSRHFGSDVLFENIHIAIQDQSRIGLVGRNGTGKSTLLKILASIEQSDSGQISMVKQLKIGYLDQHSAVNTENTIWEEMLHVFDDVIALQDRLNRIALSLSDEAILNDEKAYQETLSQYDTLQHELDNRGGYQYEATIKSVLNGFKFYEKDYHQSIGNLSGGQKTRLALAKLLLEKPDLLILDEPTNHLDIDTLSWLETYLINYQGALLIVSHDRYFLDKVVKEIYEISQKQIHHYKGNYSYYLEERDKRLALEWKQYEKQQEEIEKLEDFIAKNIVRASTTKRAQSRRKQLEKMVRLEKPKGDEKSARLTFVTEKESGNVVLQAEQLGIGYEDTLLAYPIDLDIRKQQAIAVVGPNGIGKTTLLKTLLGTLPTVKGHYKVGANVSIGYYDQEQRHLTPTKDVLSELWDDYPLMNEKDVRSVLGSFLFSGDDVKKLVASLSGGEKARLLLAKLALQKDNFLILDEPTNHLDLDSKEVLENALIDFDGTLLFISHDRYFINRVATSVLELSKNGSTLYIGDYDYYIEKKSQEKQEILIEQEKNVSIQQSDYTLSKEKQKQKRQLERQLETLEQQMHDCQERIGNIEESLASPDVFTNHEESYRLNTQLEEERQKYDTYLNEWETVALTLEDLPI
ncbi:ATP-binding cassette domain-containing protein [Granulicatella sp. zg-ZJ]|uniref:ABC-F family ATP-binding cassette domain-containing protein n=1 Tax=Granulicatella sp. zg-ZJ TaxID=2678504 RepID=UPI0013CF43CA|nr:ABC-F family ATP-binding cassette domain-containing protein [Granulicatella sp. zg-ZJ]MBS4749818.1 ABC-F family ATP-binding cassette domain-containing protein [Carnobacteriaceae bacterium zg-ZUI78]NEW61908.1 ATP-binding cassette domain-containing protein [Granulicatella sp. zg-ZJ]